MNSACHYRLGLIGRKNRTSLKMANIGGYDSCSEGSGINAVPDRRAAARQNNLAHERSLDSSLKGRWLKLWLINQGHVNTRSDKGHVIPYPPRVISFKTAEVMISGFPAETLRAKAMKV